MKRVAARKNREVLLLYRFRGSDVGTKLHGIAVRMGVLCKVIEEDQVDLPIGALLKLPGFSNEPRLPEGECTELSEQAMVLYGFSQERLNFLLTQSRKVGNPVIPLKAVVTPTNVDWTFRELYGEIAKEHEAMKERLKPSVD